MSSQIVIRTGARLHFGLLANRPRSGRRFGGAGMMIDTPGCVVAIRSRRGRPAVTGDDRVCDRVHHWVDRYLAECPADARPRDFSIDVRQTLPEHVGFGCGTQLGMAIAKALALWGEDQTADHVVLAKRISRGRRSAIGIQGFQHGGFIVDGGKADVGHVAPMVARADFPEDWRFVLVTPSHGSGLSGEAEKDAFAQLPPTSDTMAAELCRLLLMDLLPAILETRFDDCAESLFEYGRIVGDYFRRVQGGIFADRRMEDLGMQLRREGVRGVGQTSWGPTLFALCRDSAEAASVRESITTRKAWADTRIRIAAPLNRGAMVEIQSFGD